MDITSLDVDARLKIHTIAMIQGLAPKIPLRVLDMKNLCDLLILQAVLEIQRDLRKMMD